MRRPGSPKEYREMVTRMRELVPDISLRTTFITGHPGETAKDFGELYDFVEWAQFDQMGAFVYSPEDSTLAARMSDIPTRKTAERRRAKLMELQQKISALAQRSEDRPDVRRASITGVCDETEHLLEGRLDRTGAGDRRPPADQRRHRAAAERPARVRARGDHRRASVRRRRRRGRLAHRDRRSVLFHQPPASRR